MDDAALLRAYARENSEAAFRELVARHIDVVYSAALRRTRGDPHRAQEVTQMVFTDLARKSARLLDHPLLPAWLHQATQWAASNLRRSEHRRAKYENTLAHDPALRPHTTLAPDATPLDWETAQPLIDDALDSLNAADRAAILLRFFHQQPFASIGSRLGLAENAARMRVDRALEKLRRHLSHRGLTSTSAALSLALAQQSVTAAPITLAATIGTTALASASAGGTTSALGFLFMTKLPLGLSSAATLALVVGYLWQIQANDLLAARISTLETQRSLDLAARNTLETKVAAREAALNTRAAVAASTLEVPPLTPEQQERQQLNTLIRKGELDQDYAPLFRSLNLAPAQLDAFKTLLVERNQAIYDATKLAEKHDIVFASLAEQRTLTDSVLGEIDARIAATLGTASLATFREHLDLAPYLKLAGHLGNLGWSSQSFETQMNDEADKRAEKFARLLRDIAPGFPDQMHRANGWPVPWPAAFTQAASKFVPPDAQALFQRRIESIQVQHRLLEIARDAALQGKLELNESSAREYPSRKTQDLQP